MRNIVSEKLSAIKDLWKKAYPDYDKSEFNFDQNMQIRNEVMRRIKFEQLKRSSLGNFVRDAKSYLFNQRKQSVENVKTKRDLLQFFNEDIKVAKDEKHDDKIIDQTLKPKQKEYIKFVLNTLKRDGQKGRVKDQHVKKMLLDLYSFDLKHSIKDKTVKINPLHLYNSNAENLVNKYNNSKSLDTTLRNDILRKVVPKFEGFIIS